MAALCAYVNSTSTVKISTQSTLGNCDLYILDQAAYDNLVLASNSNDAQVLTDSLNSMLAFDSVAFFAAIAALSAIFVTSYAGGVIVRNLNRV
jgi:hypothetical protein